MTQKTKSSKEIWPAPKTKGPILCSPLDPQLTLTPQTLSSLLSYLSFSLLPLTPAAAGSQNGGTACGGAAREATPGRERGGTHS